MKGLSWRWIAMLVLLSGAWLGTETARGQGIPDWQLKAGDLNAIAQDKAIAAQRESQYASQLRLIGRDRFDLSRYPVVEGTENHWKQTLWATGVLEPQADYVAESLAGILAMAGDRSLTLPQRRTIQRAMQVATQLYGSDPLFYRQLGDRFDQILVASPYTDWVAMALIARLQTGLSQDNAQNMVNLVKTRFPGGGAYLPLQVALRDAEAMINPPPQPPLQDWLHWQIAPNQAQIYILCRPNRAVLCTAILKDRQGRWLRSGSRSDAPLWSVQLLARSLHGLRWHLNRGETPQGIYRLEGIMPRSPQSEFRAYGQFPLVKLFLPFEAGVKAFIPPNKQIPNDINAYQKLLPPSWRAYFPMQESFWAGKLGRSLFRIHGSGEDRDFFGGNKRFPDSLGWNPTIGCLSAVENYDPKTGQLQRADMPKILKALNLAGQGQIEGYAIVIEVAGSDDQPISVQDLDLRDIAD